MWFCSFFWLGTATSKAVLSRVVVVFCGSVHFVWLGTATNKVVCCHTTSCEVFVFVGLPRLGITFKVYSVILNWSAVGRIKAATQGHQAELLGLLKASSAGAWAFGCSELGYKKEMLFQHKTCSCWLAESHLQFQGRKDARTQMPGPFGRSLQGLHVHLMKGICCFFPGWF